MPITSKLFNIYLVIKILAPILTNPNFNLTPIHILYKKKIITK